MASSDRVVAGSVGACCMKTVQHTGTPVGVTEEVGGLATYVSYPPQKEVTYDRIVLFFGDVFGPFYINNQLVSDYFASNGYLVVAPDFFDGKPIQTVEPKGPDFDLFKWADPFRERTDKIMPTWVEAAKAKYGHKDTKYATVCYCFGGPDVLRLASADWLAAAALVHPAYITEDLFRNVKRPLLLSSAENDVPFPRARRHLAEDILVEIKAEYHLQVFAKVEHGFGNRGDPNDPDQRWAKEQSAKTVLAWFDRFCK